MRDQLFGRSRDFIFLFNISSRVEEKDGAEEKEEDEEVEEDEGG